MRRQLQELEEEEAAKREAAAHAESEAIVRNPFHTNLGATLSCEDRCATSDLSTKMNDAACQFRKL